MTSASTVDLFVGLPVELSAELVGKWLNVKDIVRLDTAFCHAARREFLHCSIFKSSYCVITSIDIQYERCSQAEAERMLNWIASRMIPIENLSVWVKAFVPSGFNLCVPEALRRLSILGEKFAPEWSSLSNLKSLCLIDYASDYDSLVNILEKCPSIINLDVSFTNCIGGALVDSLREVHSLNIEHSYGFRDRLLGDALVAKHKHSLQALFAFACNGVTQQSLNRVLAECCHLHTLSYDRELDLDFALMGNLITLITDYSESEAEWTLIQQHCRSLRYLYLIFTYAGEVHDLTHMIEAVCEMPALSALFFVGARGSNDIKCIGAADKLRDQRPLLYTDPFSYEGAWYDLFKLPI